MTLHPAAESDITEAAEFYEREGSAVVAARFIFEFRKLSALLAEQPDIGAPRSAGRRGMCMNVFPYTVIYRAEADEVRILVVKHDRKHPGYGATRT